MAKQTTTLQRRSKLSATVSNWSDELGMSRDTLTKRLRAIDFEWKVKDKISCRTIFRALSGDKEAAQARLALADAEMKEDKLKERQGRLVDTESVEKQISAVMTPVAQRFDALPNEACHECNPTDPDFAREALKRWVARSKSMIRANFTRPKRHNDK